MIHTKQKKYLDKVAQWLCDDTEYNVNTYLQYSYGHLDYDGIELAFDEPFPDNEENFIGSCLRGGYYFTILDELLNWNVSCPEEFSFANLFSLYVRDTYGVLGDEVNHLWDLYRNKLKRQWGLYGLY